jgi:hypothetical protein
MKSKTLKFIVAVTVLLAVPVTADEARVTAYTSKLGAKRVTELANETAKLVTAEKADTRVAAAADAVTASVSVHAPSAPIVVASVAKAAPETAAAAAATAVKLQPSTAARISKAAVSAAPSEVEAIVGDMCKARPGSFYAIGVSAGEAAPKASDKILPAMTAALPALKPVIARSQADFAAARRTASLALVLKHAENLLAALSGSSKESTESLLAGSETTMATKIGSLAAGPPPVLLPPFVPGGGSPGEIPADQPQTPASGRVYSTP